MAEWAVLASAPEHYRADFRRLNDALSSHILTTPDGWQGINPITAPAGLLEAYSTLTSLGYANGWLGPTREAPE